MISYAIDDENAFISRSRITESLLTHTLLKTRPSLRIRGFSLSLAQIKPEKLGFSILDRGKKILFFRTFSQAVGGWGDFFLSILMMQI